jgi:hypothetical protein
MDPDRFRFALLFERVARVWVAGTSPAMNVSHFPCHFGGRFSENAFGPSM